MPVVFRHLGIRFYFFSNEGNPQEPVHIHATRADADAKLCLLPEVGVADSTCFSRRAQADPVRIVKARRDDNLRAWHEHFGDGGSL